MNQKLKRIVHGILETMPPVDGGTAAWSEAVFQHDGVLDEYKDQALKIAVNEITGQWIRNARDPMTQGKLFHSIEVADGMTDDGEPKKRKVYRRALDVYKSVEQTDQVVDYYIAQHDRFGKEANTTVLAARDRNPNYQRMLPFPDLNEDGESA